MTETEKNFFSRRLAMTTTRGNAFAPSYLQSRLVRGKHFPRVTLAPMTGGQNDGDGEKCYKLRTTLTFLIGIGGGPKGEGMPRDVFRVVLDLLMPSWDLLRRGFPGIERKVQG